MTVEQGLILSKKLIGSKHWYEQTKGSYENGYIALRSNRHPYNYLYIREDVLTSNVWVHISPGLAMGINYSTRINSNLPARVYADMHFLSPEDYHHYGLALERLDGFILEGEMSLDDVEAMRGDELTAFIKSLARV